MVSRGFQGRSRTAAINGPVYAASFALNILSLLMPISILLIFDRVIPHQSTETLKLLSLALIIAACFEFLLKKARSTLLGWAAEQAAQRNHAYFLDKVLAANTRAFAQEAAAVHMDRFAALAHVRDHNAGESQTLSIDLPFTLIFVVMIALIGGWLVLVPIVCIGIVILFALLMKHAQRNLFELRKRLNARRYAFLSEILASILTVKANTMERQMTRRFELLQDQTAHTSSRMIDFSGFAQSYGAITAQLSVAALGLFGAYLVIQEQIGLAELAACMLLNGRVIQPLMKLLSLWVQAEAVRVAEGKLSDVHALPENRAATGKPAIQGLIELENLAVKNVHGDGLVFDSLSGRINPGEFALVESDSDAALKAFFDLLTGQIDPESGRAMIDGYLASDRTAQRGSGGLVRLESQPAILTGTLLENLSGFGDAAQIYRAKVLAARIGLERRIHRLPMGYHTKLNEGGVFERDPINRQLISLVRAMAMQPSVLLMNEPTAILEVPERVALAASLRDLTPRPTLLMASPDPRMRELADTTLRLSGGSCAYLYDWDNDAIADKEGVIAQKGAA